MADDPLLSDAQQVDSTQFIQLSGSYAPLERLNLAIPSQEPVVLLSQISSGSPVVSIAQPALLVEGGRYAALAMPSGFPFMETRSVSTAGVALGEMNMLALPDSDPSRTPGEYALAAMNSFLYGLRDDVTELRAFNESNTDIISRLANVEKLMILDEAIEMFQENIRLVDEVVAFNVPIVDDSGEPILDSRSLAMLDSVFRVLMARLAEDSLFLDGSSVATAITTGYDNLTFDEFSQAANSRLGTMDGVRALASLTLLLRRSQSEDTDNAIADTLALKSALGIAQASLLPAIVANVSGPVSEQTTSAHATQAVQLLSEVENFTGSSSNFIYASALETLGKVAADLAELEALGGS